MCIKIWKRNYIFFVVFLFYYSFFSSKTVILFAHNLRISNMIKRGGISRGVKGVADASSPFPQDTPSGVRHPADPNGLPFGIFMKTIFGQPILQFSGDAFGSNVFYFWGDASKRRPKKTWFLSQKFPKLPKTPFLFFQKFACGHYSAIGVLGNWIWS